MPPPDPDWPVYILDADVAAILEVDVDAVADALVDDRGNADAARLGERLQAGGDVDAVAVDVVALDDDVSQIDADPDHDFRLGRDLLLCRAGALHRERAVHRVDDASEFDDGAVTDQLHDAAVMGGDGRVEYGFPVPLQRRERRALVGPHHP